MGCDVVAMLLVEVVMCWGFMVLVWLCQCCNVLKLNFGCVCDVCCGKGVVVVMWC